MKSFKEKYGEVNPVWEVANQLTKEGSMVVGKPLLLDTLKTQISRVLGMYRDTSSISRGKIEKELDIWFNSLEVTPWKQPKRKSKSQAGSSKDT